MQNLILLYMILSNCKYYVGRIRNVIRLLSDTIWWMEQAYPPYNGHYDASLQERKL